MLECLGPFEFDFRMNSERPVAGWVHVGVRMYLISLDIWIVYSNAGAEINLQLQLDLRLDSVHVRTSISQQRDHHTRHSTWSIIKTKIYKR